MTLNLNDDRIKFLKEITDILKTRSEEMHQMTYGFSSVEEGAFAEGQESMLDSLIDEFNDAVNDFGKNQSKG